MAYPDSDLHTISDLVQWRLGEIGNANAKGKSR